MTPAGCPPAHRSRSVPTLPEIMTDSDRLASAVERACTDAIEAAALQHRVGETFRASVVDVSMNGGLVQITDPAILLRWMGLPGLMRFEAEVEAGKGRQVWAAIEELASGYPKDDVAATMDQVRTDAFVDLVLVNVTVTTVVDLALPAGFASGGPLRAGSSAGCGRGPASRAGESAGAGVQAGGSVLEDRTTGALIDADQDADQDAGQDTDNEADKDAGRRNVLRLLTGLPSAGVLDHRVGTLTPATIEAILADPDTVLRRLMVDPDTGWLLDAGATTYHPGRHLARTVRKRDWHCRCPAARPRPNSATSTT